jgi:hypothetical protein
MSLIQGERHVVTHQQVNHNLRFGGGEFGGQTHDIWKLPSPSLIDNVVEPGLNPWWHNVAIITWTLMIGSMLLWNANILSNV